MTIRYWLPGKNRLRYVGIIAIRSTIPKKLVAYLSGRPMEVRRRKYSIVNRIVNPHSSEWSSSPWDALIETTLSSITTMTLSMMVRINASSKDLPARVSDSNMIVYIRSRRPLPDADAGDNDDVLFFIESPSCLLSIIHYLCSSMDIKSSQHKSHILVFVPSIPCDREV